tara:strand:- start:51490 stop:52023 length:534 start_codon:yes stop_codon:yes gene_type:complete
VDPVVLDTNILVFAIEGPSEPNQDTDLKQRAELLVEKELEKESRVLLPTICLAELLAHNQRNRSKALEAYTRLGLEIRSFDTPAAMHYGRLYKAALAERKSASPSTRAILGNDALIAATALASGASRIYSHNTKDFRKWVKNLGDTLAVLDIPPLAALVSPGDPDQLILSQAEGLEP